MSEVVDAGKARYIGFSEWSRRRIEAADKLHQRDAFCLQSAAVLDAVPQGRNGKSFRCAERLASARSSGLPWLRVC